MTLTASTRLGTYEILVVLGAGGMGEVYKARDTRLDRIVAIKVLPPTLATDPQFRERFDGEARTISQLDPPTSAPCMTSANRTARRFSSCSIWKARHWRAG
jgi:serine/threonine protein kinase